MLLGAETWNPRKEENVVCHALVASGSDWMGNTPYVWVNDICCYSEARRNEEVIVDKYDWVIHEQ